MNNNDPVQLLQDRWTARFSEPLAIYSTDIDGSIYASTPDGCILCAVHPDSPDEVVWYNVPDQTDSYPH